MPEAKRFSLVRPTLQTHFHIDFNWWQQSDRNWRVYLQNFLCDEHRPVFDNFDVTETIDWIDPETAEVQQVDGLQHILITHCAKVDGFITDRTTLVDSVFRLFLANGNDPLTAVEMAEQLGRQPQLILKTLSGAQIYRGVRPIMES